jgi:hypothetical protein
LKNDDSEIHPDWRMRGMFVERGNDRGVWNWAAVLDNAIDPSLAFALANYRARVNRRRSQMRGRLRGNVHVQAPSQGRKASRPSANSSIHGSTLVDRALLFISHMKERSCVRAG